MPASIACSSSSKGASSTAPSEPPPDGDCDGGARARPTRPDRDPYLCEDLAVVDGRLVRAAIKLLHRHDPFAVAAPDDAARVERRTDGREVLGRVGLTQAAAEGAAIAYDGVGDPPLGVPEDRKRRREFVGLQKVAMSGQRPDANLVRFDPQVAELGAEVVDVDEVFEVGQP